MISLEKLEDKNNVTEQVYLQMLKKIIDETYKPGQKIPSENELKELFGVSRNTIRAVLNRLTSLGLLETRRGGGSFVKEIGTDFCFNFFIPAIFLDKNDLLDVLEFRKGIEVQAVKLAAVRALPEDIERMKALNEKSKACFYNGLHDMVMFSAINLELHTEITRASKNKMFEKMMEIIRCILTAKMEHFLVHQGEDVDSVFYHSGILECIINRKPEEAAFFMEKHLSLIIQRVHAFLENQNK